MKARNSAPEFEAAAKEAEVFEHKLQAALNVRPPDDLLDDIRHISQTPARRRNWMPLALAASLVVAVGAAGVAWKQSRQWDSVEQYLADHYSHDGARLVAKATQPVADADIQKILARLDASAGQALASHIRLIKFCPTPDGRGAHMVVDTEQGLMTVIFMPHTGVTDGEVVEFEEMHALLVTLGRGSAAIIGEQQQAVEDLQTLLRSSLVMETVDV